MIVNRIKEVIAAVRKLTGYRLIFRPNNKSFQMDVDYTHHRGPVCESMKNTIRFKCDVDCVKKGDTHILTSKRPFTKTCHAGLCELVVPVMSPTGCEGFFFLGPALLSKQNIKYKKYGSEYIKIPKYDKDKFESVEKLLTVFADFLMVENEKMAINDITSSVDNDRIKIAADFISKNMKERIKAYELAKECGLSEWYFLHLFKRTTGLPVSVYIKKVKLERAKTLLSSTTLKISSIIKETGYVNENNFFIAFKKYTGLTPRNYRISAAKNII